MLDKLEFELRKRLNVLEDSEAKLKRALSDTQSKLETCEAEKNKENQIRLSLEDELQSTVRMHEKEVNMRLKFEAKLNNLSSQ